jgi:uracil-DNA glycosylase
VTLASSRTAARQGAETPRARLLAVHQAVITCEDCPRLRQYCARVAVEKKAAHRDETYWGRPVPGFGDPEARLLMVGLAPAAHGANRTGRMFTGDAGAVLA